MRTPTTDPVLDVVETPVEGTFPEPVLKKLRALEAQRAQIAAAVEDTLVMFLCGRDVELEGMHVVYDVEGGANSYRVAPRPAPE